MSLRELGACNLHPPLLVVADDGLRHVAEQSLLHNRGLLALLWVARRLPEASRARLCADYLLPRAPLELVPPLPPPRSLSA